MGKPEDQSKKKWKGIPGTLNYWEGWAICIRDPSTNTWPARLLFPNIDGNTVREKDFKKHLHRIAAGDIDYVCSLINESPYNLDDQTLKDWLPIWEKRWMSLAAFGNQDAKQRLNRLHKAMQPCLKGKTDPEKLKEVIHRDINFFKKVLAEREKRDKPISEIIRAIVYESDYWAGEDRAWGVYKAYNRFADKSLPILGTSENLFVFLNACKDAVDSPTALCLYERAGFIFVKGECSRDHLTSSF